MAFAEGRAADALRAYDAHGEVKAHLAIEEARAAVVAAWAKGLGEVPIHEQLILAYRRDDVAELNRLARAVRQEAGALGVDQLVVTEHGERAFAAGDRVYFGKNDKALGVTNGSLGTLERIEGARMTVLLDGERERRRVVVDLSAYAHLDHGYAVTVHKSQGMTVDRTYVLASKLFDSATSYVAMSRHREHVELHWARDEFGTRAALERTLCRHRPKELALEHAQHLPSTLAEVVKDDSAFLLLAPDAQRRLVAELQEAYAQRARALPPCSAGEVFERLPEVRDARAHEHKAWQHHIECTKALEDYGRLGWLDKIRVSGAELRNEAEAAQKALTAARQACERLREDPALQERAQRIASTNNQQLGRMSERLKGWRAHLETNERVGLLEQAADQVHVQTGHAVRLSGEADLGASLQLVGTMKLGALSSGRELYGAVLKDKDGALIVHEIHAAQRYELKPEQRIALQQGVRGLELRASLGRGMGIGD